ncbi:MAG: ribulose phosphate epimerase [Nannocystaceae bacterium]|nr:ribulose phosphate epimerase [Nannocystaceae bacterium]
MMWKIAMVGTCCGLVLVGCPAGSPQDDLADTDSTEATEASSTGAEISAVDGVGSDSETDASSDEDTGDENSGTFIVMDTDGDNIAPQCDVWSQDCPEGEKCAAYVEGGGNAWNSTKCVAVADSPATPGAECMAEGGASGLDDCDYGSMCWGVGEEGVGYCVSLCTADADNPICEDPNTSCVIVNDGVLNLCLLECNPLIQDCQADGESCYPAPAGFTCAPDVSQGAGSGEVCSGINTCTGGTFCTDAAGLPACDGPTCCTSFCDTEADDVCDGGTECLALFDEGEAIPGLETLGGCLLP